jgi:hypothetical protein
VKDSVEISIITGAIAPVQNMSKQNRDFRQASGITGVVEKVVTFPNYKSL